MAVQLSDDFIKTTGINDTTLILERKGWDPIRLDEKLDLIFLSFDVDSPEPITTTSTISGMDGVIDKGTTYGPRNMTARFLLSTDSKYNYELLKTDVERLFDSREAFSIIDEDNPGRKWENVKRSGKIEWDRRGSGVGIATIPLISFSPYAVSIGSLLDPYTFESELWQFGQNIPLEDFSYSHTTREFSIWNLGDAIVDPKNRELKIYYKGASSNLTIENITTGDKWQYNGTSKAGDTILLDGVFSRKNGISIFGSTNRKVIKLMPGENKFRATGTLYSFNIEFDFRFLYL